MDTGRLILIFCAAIFIGVGVPAALFLMMKRDNSANIAGALKRGAQTARHPLKKNSDDLEELSRRVEALRKQESRTLIEPEKGKDDE